MPATDIGIDLGSSNVVIYAKQKGITILEPSVVAYDKDTEKILAYGEEAQRLIDRTQGNIVAIRPLRNGVISDYRMTELLLKHFIQKALGRRAFRKPYISICVPSGVTEVEKRAVEEASYQAGARDVTRRHRRRYDKMRCHLSRSTCRPSDASHRRRYIQRGHRTLCAQKP